MAARRDVVAGAPGGTLTALLESPRAATAVTLTLRGGVAPPSPATRVAFADGVVDNEHMGRRKSKCA